MFIWWLCLLLFFPFVSSVLLPSAVEEVEVHTEPSREHRGGGRSRGEEEPSISALPPRDLKKPPALLGKDRSFSLPRSSRFEPRIKEVRENLQVLDRQREGSKEAALRKSREAAEGLQKGSKESAVCASDTLFFSGACTYACTPVVAVGGIAVCTSMMISA